MAAASADRGILQPPQFTRRGGETFGAGASATDTEREIVPVSGFDCEFRFQRVVLLEFTYAKHAKPDDVALLVHPLHNGVALCLAHVSRRIRESDFEEVCFRVEP